MNFAVDGSLACSGCPRAPGGTWEPCPGVAVVPPPPIPLHQDPGTWRPARELQNDANGPHPFDRTFDRTSRPSSRAPNPASRGVAPIRVATPTRHTRHAACQTRLAAGRCAPALGGRACAKRASRDLEPWFGWSGSRLRGTRAAASRVRLRRLRVVRSHATARGWRATCVAHTRRAHAP